MHFRLSDSSTYLWENLLHGKEMKREGEAVGEMGFRFSRSKCHAGNVGDADGFSREGVAVGGGGVKCGRKSALESLKKNSLNALTQADNS